MTRWYSAEGGGAQRVLAAWKDAPVTNLELLGMLLEVAQDQVMEYAPAEYQIPQTSDLVEPEGIVDGGGVSVPLATILDGGSAANSGPVIEGGAAAGWYGPLLDNPPARYVYAQLQQAKNLWNAGRVAAAGDGSGEFQFVPRPLDKEIQRIIRPRAGVPNVF